MQVLFECRDPEGARMRAFAQQRARFVMRRLGWLAPRVRIHLSDINGPAGGTDKRCLLEIATPQAEPIVITSIARDWRAALDGALARGGQALLRAWRRMRDHGRARARIVRASRRGLRHA
jgi:hypothetical protein